MKRLRDEVYMNSQFKRPFGTSSSRGESYVPPQAPVGSGGGVGGSGSDVGTGVSVAPAPAPAPAPPPALAPAPPPAPAPAPPPAPAPAPALAPAPASAPPPVPAPAPAPALAPAAGSAQKLTTNDALSYLKQVKDMFQDQREKYDRFLDVMKDFKAQRIDTAGVIARVKELFKGHPNLILGFNTFLPKGYEITLTDAEEDRVNPPKRTVEFEEAISFVNKIKKRFENDDHVYKSFLDILNMYRKEHKGITEVYGEVATLFGDHPDLLGEFTRFLPDASATAAVSHGSLGRHSFHRFDERNSAMPAIKQSHIEKRHRKDRVVDSNGERDLSVEPVDMEEDKSIVKIQKEQRKHAERENKDRKKSDRDDRDPDNEINGDVNMHRLSDKRKSAQKVEDYGGNANFDSFEDKDSVKSTYSRELRFCEKVKERLRSAEDYQAFLKCLHIYSKEIISRHELQGLVADLLGKYPDLMEGFNEFFERCERIDGFLAGVMGKKAWNEGNSSKALRMDDKEKDQKREIDGGKEKERYNLKYLGKSIQELDLSNCERCTPSYRLLPDDYPVSSASQRSELGSQVLNDKWVSVTSGSEDYSFKNMRKNQYEESLFRCEDDRFELDMLLESVSSTAKRAEELLNCSTDNSMGLDGPIRIEDHFTALNLRCTERLYGDHGLDVIDILRKNPSLALPVILTRLKQKQEEWTKCRSDFNKVWAEIYHKNHYKSLDHRSFYFKQQDSKNLSTKSLVAEIKELKEKMQKEDDVLLSIAAGNKHSLTPHMEFEYSDPDVHGDVFRIIKYSCEEICSTKDQLQKVLRFWTSFLEPMLGVHSRPHDMDTSEDGSPQKCNAAETTSAGLIESEGSPVQEASVTNLKQAEIDKDFHSMMSLQQTNCISAFMNMDALAVALPSSERLINPEIAVTSGPGVNNGLGANSSCVIDGPLEEVSNPKHDTEDRLSSEGGKLPTSNQLRNGKFVEGSRQTESKQDSVDPCTVEKEEGELSPNGDFEDNFAAYHNSGLKAVPEKKFENGGVQAQIGCNEVCADVGGENDVDADDEDSENISEAGEDVSGSESAADECSREHEEEEDGEHDNLEGKAESEGEADNTCDAVYNGGDCASVPQSERFLLTCKPLCKYATSPLVGDEPMERRIFYGSDTFYVLFRLHQTLYERILSAKLNLVSSESKWRSARDASSDPYARFISALFSLLDGSSDNAKFEDDCRSLIGNQAYVLFTLDKLIYKLVKQLQVVAGDEVGFKLLQLFDYENSRKPEKYVDSVYYENVRFLLHDENVYRLESTSNPTQLSIQLMDDGNEKSEVVAVSVDPTFGAYLNYEYLSVNQVKKGLSPIMLKRNMRKYHNLDESAAFHKATENTRIMNGLECKMTASTSKISYVLDTEDSFIRLCRRKDRPTVGYSRTFQSSWNGFTSA